MFVSFDELFEHEMEFAPAVSAKGDAAKGEPQPNELIFPRGGGVYLLTDASDRVVLLSAAADLRRALRGRLLEPPAEGKDEERHGRPRADLSEVVRRIRWRTAHSMFELNLAYLRTARRLLPDSYKENLAFGPCWFVHVDPDAAIPRFVMRKTLRGAGVEFGPFAAQNDSSRLVQILEDAFDLCRYTHILEQAPHGQACAYFEMGRCPAPCDGSIPLSQYRQMIRAALAFALGDRQALYNDLERQMREASTSLAFERAALIKQRLERAKAIEHDAFRWLHRVEDFRFIVLQRGGGRSKLRPFFITGGDIEVGEIIKLKEAKDRVTDWIARVNDATPRVACDSEEMLRRSEQIWLVCHYLFKRDAPGLFFHVSQLPGADELAAQIIERFQVKRAPKSEQQEPGLSAEAMEPP